MPLKFKQVVEAVDKVDLIIAMVRRLAIVISAIILAPVIAYFIVCTWQWFQSPADLDIVVTPYNAYPGDDITINFVNVNRYKVCDIERTFTILTKTDSRLYVYQQQNVKVHGLGRVPPFTTQIKLSKEIVPGLANVDLMAEYRCPNNIIQHFYPTIRHYPTQFYVIPKKTNDPE